MEVKQGVAFAPIEELTEEELRSELQSFRNLWTWIPEDIKVLLLKIGTEIRLVQRNFKGIKGDLCGLKFELKELEIATESIEFNYDTGQHFLETKVVRAPMSGIISLEFISNSVEVQRPMPGVDGELLPDIGSEI